MVATATARFLYRFVRGLLFPFLNARFRLIRHDLRSRLNENVILPFRVIGIAWLENLNVLDRFDRRRRRRQ